MKDILTSCMGWVLIISWVGCKPSISGGEYPGTQGEKSEKVITLDFDQIMKRGYLTAIMDNSSTGLFIYKGETMGYEYDLLKLFCKEHNLQLRIHTTANLNEAFKKLNEGQGDILAYNLTVTKARKERIDFTHYHNLQQQVLIQRKPAHWRQMKLHQIEASLIRNPIELIGKDVYVRPYSAYYDRLVNLSNEIGGDIKIVHGGSEVETEQLIRQVAEGTIDYTVADENVALVNATYHPILDVKTPVSFPTQIAWGVRKTGPQLLDSLNQWILKMRKKTDYYVIYDKYFRSSKSALRRAKSKFSTINQTEKAISPYDSLIKKGASDLGWDWYLLAAQLYRESKFDPKAKSWAGAIGLMQVLPHTAADYGIKYLYNPGENIAAGTRHLKWLQDQWKDEIVDAEERIYFVLASYNVGLGHLQDAVRLTEKYGGDPKKWEDVKTYLLKKSHKKYHQDPVVKFGYCRGAEPVAYVKVILEIYQNYVDILKRDPTVKNAT